MTLFRHIFTLVLLSSSFAFCSSDDEAGAGAVSSSNSSVARSQGSVLSNPEDGFIDNRTGQFVALAAQATQATRIQTPTPDFASQLPADLPYRGSVFGANQTEALGNGVYHLKGTDQFVVRDGSEFEMCSKRNILYMIEQENLHQQNA